MLVLFETSCGFAIFKVLKEKKLNKIENLYKEFETPEKASKIIQLKHFEKFADAEDALKVATAVTKGKVPKSLKNLLKRQFTEDEYEQLAVADPKLGGAITTKLNISCVSNNSIQALMRCIRSQQESLVSEMSQRERAAMALGVAHGLSRYKFKFSADKIDKMVIEAVSALDELDKELNNYIMRCKEWYGWHFPELSKVIAEGQLYVMTVLAIGMRENAVNVDLSDILSEDQEQKVKELAEVSMGTEITEDDWFNIKCLCEEVLNLQKCRNKLSEYLKNRMAAIAPNVTPLVGEMVGARLIAHAGSLVNLAKHPASTIQILGAEKALFRALKAKHDTPKYGLIYHATLVGQSKVSARGKISRMLAAKLALAARVDAFGEEEIDVGIEHRAYLERKLKLIEEGKTNRISGLGKSKAKRDRYDNKSEVMQYNASGDSFLPSKKEEKTKKRVYEMDDTPVSSKKIKREENDDEN